MSAIPCRHGIARLGQEAEGVMEEMYIMERIKGYTVKFREWKKCGEQRHSLGVCVSVYI